MPNWQPFKKDVEARIEYLDTLHDADVETVVAACETALNFLWNLDSQVADNKKEGENIIVAVRRLLGKELDSPWQ